MKASEIPFKGKVETPRRIFRTRGENEYSLEIEPHGITFYVSRMRRTSHELWGELSVTLTNGHFPSAKTIDKVLSAADVNLSSAQARVTRAKMLKDRIGTDGEALDWTGFMEELSVKAIEAERHGDPSVELIDFPKETDPEDTWTLDGFPVLKRHPTVLLGKGASGKSYLAMWIAGRLAQQGMSVAYLDWELAGDDHRTRVERLFQPVPRGIHYVRCNHPLRDQMDRLGRILKEHRCQFAIFDSVGPASRASGGRFNDGDLGQEYFGLVRRFGVGSLHVAHPPKTVDDEKDATIYGSAFFGYLARSLWFVQAADTAPPGQLLMGLYHQKMTTGAKLAPRAYRLVFEGERTRVEQADLHGNDDLVAKLPLLDRMKFELKDEGAMTAVALADALGTNKNVVRAMVSRHKSVFSRLGNKIGLTGARTDEVPF